MDSRISVILDDRSVRSTVELGSVGATVIQAERGGVEPVLIARGNESRILSLFGRPGATNSQVWDVLEYNRNHALWVSAPSRGGKFGGVFVTQAGTKPFVSGQESEAINFSRVVFEESFGVGDGVKTNFTGAISGEFLSQYIFLSVDAYLGGVSLEATVDQEGSNPEILTAVLGAGTFTRETGAFDFTFAQAPAEGIPVTLRYAVNLRDTAYFAIFNKNPQADDLAVRVEAGEVAGTLVIHASGVTATGYRVLSGFPVTVGLLPDAKDGFGRYIYAERVFAESDLMTVVVNPDLGLSTIVADTDLVNLRGGARGVTGATEIQQGWNYFQDVGNYPANIFFDCTALAGVAATFETLRNVYQKFSTYLCATPNGSRSEILGFRNVAGVNSRGVKFYGGWAQVLNSYGATSFASSLMGRIARNHGDMSVMFNGLQVSDVNENGLGGQIGGSIIRLFQSFSESDIGVLERSQINPIVNHPFYGVMVVRDRTSLRGEKSDYSQGGHSRLADFIIENVVRILRAQLSKANDDEHRSRIRWQCQSLLEPLLVTPYNLLRELLVLCDERNNTDEVLSREEFVLDVIIKFTPFSNYIKFFFTNVGQTVNVDEIIGG